MYLRANTNAQHRAATAHKEITMKVFFRIKKASSIPFVTNHKLNDIIDAILVISLQKKVFQCENLIFVFVLKDLLYRDVESSGELERQGQGGCVPARFDGNDSLASDANLVGQLLLGYLAVLKTQPANLIRQIVATHPPSPLQTESE